MSARWSKEVELIKFRELHELYVTQNKSIGEVGRILSIAPSSVYDRLLRLGIKPDRSRKINVNNQKSIATIPCIHTKSLAEFFGIMLGDGCLTPTQVTVTLGNKELDYVNYVSNLITKLFKVVPKIYVRKKGYRVIYFGSVKVVRWLQSNGLVFNKVKDQVKTPEWIFKKHFLMEGFLRGFFDTDGSVYRLRFGVQLAFTNRSIPLLRGLKYSLDTLGYFPSKICGFKIYLTKKKCVLRFIKKINPANLKHRQRFNEFVKYYDSK
jgi:DNA-binding transcriptional regulator WhiA